MKIIRKSTSSIVTDQYGIEHPELTITYISLPEDKLNKWLEINCIYYHTQECDYIPLSQFSSFTFKFNSNSIPRTSYSLGWPTYDELKTQIEINDNGQLIILNPDVYTWILNQNYILDFEGKVFAENWEIID
jgi:hypothetical protein